MPDPAEPTVVRFTCVTELAAHLWSHGFADPGPARADPAPGPGHPNEDDWDMTVPPPLTR